MACSNSNGNGEVTTGEFLASLLNSPASVTGDQGSWTNRSAADAIMLLKKLDSGQALRAGFRGDFQPMMSAGTRTTEGVRYTSRGSSFWYHY